MRAWIRSLISATGIMTAALGSQAQGMPAFDHIVVFGDSLSDSGNAGRASNGPVWVEHLADKLGLPLEPSRNGGANFAVGGARLDPGSGPTNLRAQADLYLKAPRSPGRTLYVVYGGGNDLLAAVGTAQVGSAADRAIASLKSIVDDLAARGATDILVPNMPDIGMTPAVRSHGPEAAEEARRLSRRFNEVLDRALSGSAGAPNKRLHRLDVQRLAERVLADPGASGFTNVAQPCQQTGRCEGFLFWDGVHPTTQAHRHLAEAAIQALSTP
jgi:phospholipase/lecithinase/hemolysin